MAAIDARTVAGTAAALSRSHARVLALMRLALMSVLLAVVSPTVADPDLWGHVKFGGDIVAAGSLPDRDPYSFTSDIPWVNHEWLAEVLMFGAWRFGGAFGLGGLRLALCVATVGLIAVELGRHRLSPIPHDVLLGLAIISLAGAARMLRPQSFSFLLFAALLVCLLRASSRQVRCLWALPVLFVLWVNLHGGWLVGAGVLGIWTVWQLIDRREKPRYRAAAAVAAALSIVCTLGNPYGVGMWRFLFETVDLGRDRIMEWQPIYTQTPNLLLWGGIVGLVAAGLLISREWRPAWRPIVLAVLAFASFRVLRILPFLGLAAVLFSPPWIASISTQLRHRGGTTPPRHSSSELWLLGVLSLLVVLASGIFAARAQRCIEMDGEWLPEAEAAAFVEGNGLTGRMVTWFDYGEYGIWHFSPRVKVSMDGRRETVYSSDFLTRHGVLDKGEPDALRILDGLDANYVWMPKARPIVPLLRQAGWIPVFEGPLSVIFATKPGLFQQPLPIPAGPRCFPGL